MAEIADNVLAELQGAYRILDTVMKHPEGKMHAQRALKAVNPKVSLPEFDIKETISQETAALRKEITELKNQLKNEKEDGRIETTFARLKAERGYTDDGMDKLKKLMVDKSIADPEAAADHFDRLNPKPDPVNPSGWTGTKLFDESEGTELDRWFKNPEKARDEEISAVFGQRK